jgi:hypothetical protein
MAALALVIADLWAATRYALFIDGTLSYLHVFAAWAEAQPAAIVALFSVAVGFLLGRGRHPAGYRGGFFQNRGEATLSRALVARFAGPDYHLLNHVTLPVSDGTTQVDHILVSRFGVFVIETKDYQGWIFGSPDSRQWTQVSPPT